MTNKELGALIKRQRKLNRLSQEDLAVKSNTTRVQISRIENNAIDPGFSSVVSILETLGKTIQINDK